MSQNTTLSSEFSDSEYYSDKELSDTSDYITEDHGQSYSSNEESNSNDENGLNDEEINDYGP